MHNNYFKPYTSARKITVTGYGNITPFPEGVIRGFKIEGANPKHDVAVVTADGQDLIIEGLAANIIHPIAIKQIKETGTTASKVTIFW